MCSVLHALTFLWSHFHGSKETCLPKHYQTWLLVRNLKDGSYHRPSANDTYKGQKPRICRRRETVGQCMREVRRTCVMSHHGMLTILLHQSRTCIRPWVVTWHTLDVWTAPASTQSSLQMVASFYEHQSSSGATGQAINHRQPSKDLKRPVGNVTSSQSEYTFRRQLKTWIFKRSRKTRRMSFVIPWQSHGTTSLTKLAELPVTLHRLIRHHFPVRQLILVRGRCRLFLIRYATAKCDIAEHMLKVIRVRVATLLKACDIDSKLLRVTVSLW